MKSLQVTSLAKFLLLAKKMYFFNDVESGSKFDRKIFDTKNKNISIEMQTQNDVI